VIAYVQDQKRRTDVLNKARSSTEQHNENIREDVMCLGCTSCLEFGVGYRGIGGLQLIEMILKVNIDSLTISFC
jgi:hypothetical protein